MKLLIIFLGGGLGSVVRFYLGRLINTYALMKFPLGTFGVNMLACFLLGALAGWADHKQVFSAEVRLFLIVGFCGGFSTFSAFSYESLQLLQQGFYTTMLLYAVSSVVLCITMTFAGLYLVQRL